MGNRITSVQEYLYASEDEKIEDVRRYVEFLFKILSPSEITYHRYKFILEVINKYDKLRK